MEKTEGEPCLITTNTTELTPTLQRHTADTSSLKTLLTQGDCPSKFNTKFSEIVPKKRQMYVHLH